MKRFQEEEKETSTSKSRSARKSKGGKSNGKRSKTRGKFSDREVLSSTNDVSWYSKNEVLLRNAASIPFGDAIGARLDPYGQGSALLDTYVPGITTISLVHGPGVADSALTAANVCADNLYSYVRQSNSGGKNYDPNDLMSYLLAVDEAYILFYEASRILGVINLYNNENKYAPRGLVTALGWDYDDIIANLANFRYQLNAYGTRLNALPVPNKWPYYKRHQWMYSGLYADGTSAKAQLYAFKPAIYRVRNDETGVLETRKLNQPYGKVNPTTPITNASGRTVQNFIDSITEVYEALINSQDIGTIGGDIKRAFGDDGLVKVSLVPDVYTIVPVYDEEVLSQMQNLTVVRGLGNLDISMDNALHRGDVVYEPYMRIGADMVYPNGTQVGCTTLNQYLPSANAQVINFNLDNPGPGDVIVASRLMCSTNDKMFKYKAGENEWTALKEGDSITVGTDYLAAAVSAAGSEIVASVQIWTMDNFGDVGPIELYPMYDTVTRGTELGYAMMRLSKFKFHPGIYAGGFTGLTLSTEAGLFLEMDKYALLQRNVIANMHSVAMLSQFDVPVTR